MKKETLQDLCLKVIGGIFGADMVSGSNNSTYQTISFKFTENTLSHHDHTGEAASQSRKRVIMEIQDDMIWFGGSVRDDSFLKDMLTKMGYTINQQDIGSSNKFPFYGILAENNDGLNQALYSIVIPALYYYVK